MRVKSEMGIRRKGKFGDKKTLISQNTIVLYPFFILYFPTSYNATCQHSADKDEKRNRTARVSSIMMRQHHKKPWQLF